MLGVSGYRLRLILATQLHRRIKRGANALTDDSYVSQAVCGAIHPTLPLGSILRLVYADLKGDIVCLVATCSGTLITPQFVASNGHSDNPILDQVGLFAAALSFFASKLWWSASHPFA